MSRQVARKLIALLLASALLMGTVGEAFAAKKGSAGTKPVTSTWQVAGSPSGSWD